MKTSLAIVGSILMLPACAEELPNQFRQATDLTHVFKIPAVPEDYWGNSDSRSVALAWLREALAKEQDVQAIEKLKRTVRAIESRMAELKAFKARHSSLDLSDARIFRVRTFDGRVGASHYYSVIRGDREVARYWIFNPNDADKYVPAIESRFTAIDVRDGVSEFEGKEIAELRSYDLGILCGSSRLTDSGEYWRIIVHSGIAGLPQEEMLIRKVDGYTSYTVLGHDRLSQ
jgi:hypothetical protein